jgi:hypothetical protein
VKIPKSRNATGLWRGISGFRHFGCREAEEAAIFGIESSNFRFAKIPLEWSVEGENSEIGVSGKGLASRKEDESFGLGPIGFRGSGSQETELHVNATPEIAKRKSRKWVPSTSRRIRVTEAERGGRASAKVPKDHRSRQKGEILETGKS